jgi:hypothetical protein
MKNILKLFVLILAMNASQAFAQTRPTNSNSQTPRQTDSTSRNGSTQYNSTDTLRVRENTDSSRTKNNNTKMSADSTNRRNSNNNNSNNNNNNNNNPRK